MAHQPRTLEVRMQDVLDRICKPRGITRSQLAQELGVNVNSLSAVLFRGETSLKLVERLARMAKVTPEELLEIELGWLEERAGRRHAQGYSRALEIIEALREEADDMRGWLRRKDLLDESRKSRRRRAVHRLMKDHLAGG